MLLVIFSDSVWHYVADTSKGHWYLTSIHFEATWSEQYISFAEFFPLLSDFPTGDGQLTGASTPTTENWCHYLCFHVFLSKVKMLTDHDTTISIGSCFALFPLIIKLLFAATIYEFIFVFILWIWLQYIDGSFLDIFGWTKNLGK